MAGFNDPSAGAKLGLAPNDTNTQFNQLISGLDELRHRVMRNTGKVYMLHQQLVGSRPEPVQQSPIREATSTSNVFNMLDALRDQISELEAAIERFYNP
jgi:hypothetical protein